MNWTRYLCIAGNCLGASFGAWVLFDLSFNQTLGLGGMLMNLWMLIVYAMVENKLE
jgi:hypothetical protein